MNLGTLTIKADGPLSRELGKRRDVALAARTAASEATARQAVNMRERDRLRRELVESHAEGTGSAVKRATKAVSDHDATIESEAARAEGLALAAERRERDVRAFVSERLDGLLAEHRAATAEAARDRVARALNGLTDAVAAWSEAARTTTDLISAAGQGMTLRTADLPPALTALAREASRIPVSSIPAPLPEDMATARLYEPPSAPGEDVAPVGVAVFR